MQLELFKRKYGKEYLGQYRIVKQDNDISKTKKIKTDWSYCSNAREKKAKISQDKEAKIDEKRLLENPG